MEAVATALVDAGCEVSVIDVGPDIFHVLERRRSELDLVFNNAVSRDGSLDVLTYEAGVEDVTPACGTGSTAAAYVCARLGRTSLPVRVRLLGGELVIDARGDSMTMRGPAEYMRPFALEWSAERVLPLGPIVEHLGVL